MKHFLILATMFALASCGDAHAADGGPACKSGENTAQFHAYVDDMRKAGEAIRIVTIDQPDMVQNFIAAATLQLGHAPPFDPKTIAAIELVSGGAMPFVVIRAIDANTCTVGTMRADAAIAAKLLRAAQGTGASLAPIYTPVSAPFIVGGSAMRKGIGCTSAADVERLLVENVTVAEALGKIATHKTAANCAEGGETVKLVGVEKAIVVRGEQLFILHFQRADGSDLYSWCQPEDVGPGV